MILTGVEVEDESVRKVLISCKSDLLEMCEENSATLRKSDSSDGNC